MKKPIKPYRQYMVKAETTHSETAATVAKPQK
jgi:hypothetical protein